MRVNQAIFLSSYFPISLCRRKGEEGEEAVEAVEVETEKKEEATERRLLFSNADDNNGGVRSRGTPREELVATDSKRTNNIYNGDRLRRAPP